MQELAKQARSLIGIRLTTGQLNNLSIFEQELLNWNAQVNLTAIKEPEQIRVKHFLDSLTCLLVMGNPGNERIIDVGTGAGFPGLPLKIVTPSIQLTLLESVRKKTDFCSHVIQKLGLNGAEVICERAEALGQDPGHRQRYDWALARAVSILPVLVEYLLPLVHVGGTVIAMKGEGAPVETQNAEHAIKLLGGHLRKLIPVILPGVVEQRYLVVIDKVAATPDAYPRRVGLVTKHPLMEKKIKQS